MRDDLGTGEDGVHAAAERILRFWLEETPASKRFVKDDALDREIAGRFGVLRDAVMGTRARGWTEDARTLLAAVILLDQFSRNIRRDTAEAFAADPLARSLTETAVARGWDLAMTTEERQFLYMPMMHSESRADQATSIALFEALGDADILKFARDHAAVIARFGRFPSRNAALGRASTPDEQDYLSRSDAGW